jgi:integrase
MARTARNTALETRTARLRLKVRRKPYWTPTGRQGIYVGYRRLKRGNGTWSIKRYLGRDEQAGGTYHTEGLDAEADDYVDADGAVVLTYFQAVEAAIKRGGTEMTESQRTRRYTVANAVTDYVRWLETHRKTAHDAKLKLQAYAVPFFGERIVADLKPEDFEQWLSWASTHTPKGRRTDKRPKVPTTPKELAAAKAKAARPVIDAGERKRRKRSTLNRVISNVKACLNRAFQDGHVSSDSAWRRLRKFKGADSARILWLSADQATRLINAAAPDFRPIIHAAMLSGCRWGELRALKCRDYDPVSGSVNVAESKSGKPRRVYLTDDGKAAFESWTAGRPVAEVIFKDRFGNAWGSHDQVRPIAAACTAAKIDPPVSFHVLRHSYASQLVQAGVSLAVVAEALGHSDTRMVSKHYGHLSPSHVASEIRANLPALGVPIDRKVVAVRP